MRRTAYRLTQRRYGERAYAGTGSLRRNDRWHRAGIPVVYAAESPPTVSAGELLPAMS